MSRQSQMRDMKQRIEMLEAALGPFAEAYDGNRGDVWLYTGHRGDGARAPLHTDDFRQAVRLRRTRSRGGLRDE